MKRFGHRDKPHKDPKCWCCSPKAWELGCCGHASASKELHSQSPEDLDLKAGSHNSNTTATQGLVRVKYFSECRDRWDCVHSVRALFTPVHIA